MRGQLTQLANCTAASKKHIIMFFPHIMMSSSLSFWILPPFLVIWCGSTADISKPKQPGSMKSTEFKRKIYTLASEANCPLKIYETAQISRLTPNPGAVTISPLPWFGIHNCSQKSASLITQVCLPSAGVGSVSLRQAFR